MPATIKKYQEALAAVGRLVGQTPLVELKSLSPSPNIHIYAKLEWHQLGGSVKTRAAYNIIKTAIERGELGQGKQLLDASSGNTAIAYAHIAAALGIPLTIILPENASVERKRILRALGTKLIFSSPFGGTDEAQEKAKALALAEPEKYYYADQYSNPANWQAHYYGTSEEIWAQTAGKITHFVTALGTTGSFVGNARGLKEKKPAIQLASLQPDGALHGLEGWKHLPTAYVPPIYDDSLAHHELPIDSFQAYDMLRRLAKEEGLLVSPSAAANVLGAYLWAQELPPEQEAHIVTLLPDSADKYGEVIEQIFPY